MGIVIWVVAGLAAFLATRLFPLLRGSWILELVTAVLSALVAGFIATALDFGGWREPEWRAGVFALLVSFAAVAATRLLRTRTE